MSGSIPGTSGSPTEAGGSPAPAERSGRIRPGAWAVIAGLGLLALAAMLRRLADFPPVHVDEAWTGLFASRILHGGLNTPHEMNTYTGPLYPWLLSRVFGGFGISVLSLRLPGVLFNAAAFLLMAVHLGRRFGERAVMAWLLLFASSAMCVMKSRLAWEVYALQPLLLTLILILGRRLLEEPGRCFWTAALFLTANLVGVQNHFIFISVPASLFVAAAAALVLYGDADARELFLLAAAGLLMVTVFFFAKRALTDGFWSAHKTALLLLFWTAPLAFAGLYRGACALCARRPDAVSGMALGAHPAARKSLKLLLAGGVAVFFVFHWVALVQIWSGASVLMRMTALVPPVPVRVAMYAWSSFLLGALFWYMLSRLEAARYRELSPYERLLLLWPLVYAAVFPLFRTTNSIRYYNIPSFLFLAALAVVLPRLPALRRPRLLVPVVLGALALHVCFWRETGPSPERRPARFRVGWHREESWHFTRLDGLARLMESEGACELTDRVPSIDLPLRFHHLSREFPCRPGRTLLTSYCGACTEPPYVLGTVK